MAAPHRIVEGDAGETLEPLRLPRQSGDGVTTIDRLFHDETAGPTRGADHQDPHRGPPSWGARVFWKAVIFQAPSSATST